MKKPDQNRPNVLENDNFIQDLIINHGYVILLTDKWRMRVDGNREKIVKYRASSTKKEQMNIIMDLSDNDNIPIFMEIPKKWNNLEIIGYFCIVNNASGIKICTKMHKKMEEHISPISGSLNVSINQLYNEFGWLENGFLNISVFILKNNMKNTKSQPRKKSRINDDDDFRDSDSEQFDCFSSIASRSNYDRVNKMLRVDALLSNQPPEISVYDEKRTVGYAGLINQGATCYMNSFLQTLYHIPSFRRIIYEINTEGENSSDSICLNLQRMFGLMQLSTDPVSTEDLTKSFGWDTSDISVQHDIEEFSRVLLDAIKAKIKDTPQSTKMSKIFTGKVLSSIYDSNNNLIKTQEDIFEDIQLVVKGCNNIEESLLHYTEPQLIEKYSDGNRKYMNVYIRNKFINYPDVLFFHLQRFEYDSVSSSMIKINTKFEFKSTIDMSPYLQSESDDGYLFSLIGVIVHSGNPIGGHYYSYLKTKNSDQWYLFNDSSVTVSDFEKAVFSNYGGSLTMSESSGKSKTYSAYILIYARANNLGLLYEPIQGNIIPPHVFDYVKLKYLSSGKSGNDEMDIHLKLYNDSCIKENCRRGLCSFYQNSPIKEIEEYKSVSLKDIYLDIAKELGLKWNEICLWSISHPFLVSPIPCVDNKFASSLSSSSIYIQSASNYQLIVERLIIFLVLFDRTDPKNVLRFISSIEVTPNDTPLSVTHRYFISHGVNIPNDIKFFIQTKPLDIIEVCPYYSFFYYKTMNGSYLFIQSASADSSMFIEQDLPSSSDKDEKYPFISYFTLFPEAIGNRADICFRQMNDVVLFNLVSKKENAPIMNIKFPSQLTLSELKKYLFHIYYPRLSFDLFDCFIFVKKNSLPIQEDDVDCISSLFREEPSINVITIMKAPKGTYDKKNSCIRLVYEIYTDSRTLGQQSSKMFPFDCEVSNVKDYISRKYQIPDNQDIKLISCKANKIKKILANDCCVNEIQNPIRIDISPKIKIDAAFFYARVLFPSKSKEEMNGLCDIPFFFPIIEKEVFVQTKTRLNQYLKLPEELLSAIQFKMRQKSNYGIQKISEKDVLFDLLNQDDKILIHYSPKLIETKRRKENPSNVLRIKY